jgi:hypothetical protein
MKANHSCKSDGGHLCDDCFRDVASHLGEENTRIVQKESGQYIVRNKIISSSLGNANIIAVGVCLCMRSCCRSSRVLSL